MCARARVCVIIIIGVVPVCWPVSDSVLCLKKEKKTDTSWRRLYVAECMHMRSFYANIRFANVRSCQNPDDIRGDQTMSCFEENSNRRSR